MEQIYYTQCPLGYGLGASNGFQIKRKSAGYPDAADFRHLGMKPFLPASRALAPPSLRYRRDGDVIEVAWLTPRAQEYLTERGPWGRPGGLFAHGLRLEPEELAGLANWPAGLFDAASWVREDREPTRGRSPEPFAIPDDSQPHFDDVARLAKGWDAEWLARLLTGLAIACREGRTLFLIDEPGRLGDAVRLLTFALPAPLRPAATFSSYHDRPEDLAGFRLQGTVSAARPNRAMLTSLGYMADAASRTIEPTISAAPWASTVAGWLTRGDAASLRSWEDFTRSNPKALRLPEAFAEGWLDGMMNAWALTKPPVAPPSAATDWAAISATSAWVGEAGLSADWNRARGPRWWISAAAQPGSPSAMQRAFLSQTGTLRGSINVETAPLWGEAIAACFAGRPAADLFRVARQVFKELPAPARTGLMTGLIGKVDAEVAEALLQFVRQDRAFDASALLPLEARGAVATLLDKQDSVPLDTLLAQAFRDEGRALAVLDALELAVRERGRGDLHAAAEGLGRALIAAEPGPKAVGVVWGLRRDEPERWLRPYLRALFAHIDGPAAWRTLLDPALEAARPHLAAIALDVALGQGLPTEAYCWAIEELFLTCDDRARPSDPAWADAYLERVSFLDLVRRGFLKKSLLPPLLPWLKSARARGELGESAASRLHQAAQYCRSLAEKDPEWLASGQLPEVPPRDRGAMLGQILAGVAGASAERLDLCLESCRKSWPGAFDAGVPGLDGIARPLARVLLPFRSDPTVWLANLGRIVKLLGIADDDGHGFEPDSLAAEVVATTLRVHDPIDPRFEPWELRKLLLLDDRTWKALAVDARRDLHGENPTESALDERRRAEEEDKPAEPAVLKLWERQLERFGTFVRATTGPRFFTLMLNACDGRRLVKLAAARGIDLGTQPDLRDLPWWPATNGSLAGQPDDLRNGFAMTAPLAPLPDDSLQILRVWIGTPKSFQEEGTSPPAEHRDFVPIDDSPEDRDGYGLADADFAHLSPIAKARWFCLDALTVFARDRGDDEFRRWGALLSRSRHGNLPLHYLGRDEPYQFVAWLIHLTSDIGQVPLPELATELARLGLTDGPRIAAWREELRGLEDETGPLVSARFDLLDFLNQLPREIERRRKESAERRPT